jgi:RHS repeat-associated protein
LARYAQRGGIDEPLVEFRLGTSAFYEQDGLGSVTSLSGSPGTILDSHTYDTFGNATALSGSFLNPYRYTARDYDPETGLQYSRARYYDEAVGRFISEDPAGFAGGPNLYASVQNRPMTFNDPFGLQMHPYENITGGWPTL